MKLDGSFFSRVGLPDTGFDWNRNLFLPLCTGTSTDVTRGLISEESVNFSVETIVCVCVCVCVCERERERERESKEKR